MMRRVSLWMLAATALWGQNAVQDFQNRVAEYGKLHDKAKSGMPKLKPTDSPEAINRYERQLALRIAERREHVRTGNIFTPEIAAEFKKFIAATMRGPDGAGIRQSLQRSEPLNLKALAVNRPYPDGIPLQTTPPSLLLNLPKLPKGYEYRFLGQNLLLFDVEANLIVDLIPNAIP